ncbi:MAG TPA: LpqB family beta-propeller domain-containing protein [Gemmatimonadales bacterium]|nr:LpqB family beta-propeller domain-containing protein [Gemmatimonadales bacterium]
MTRPAALTAALLVLHAAAAAAQDTARAGESITIGITYQPGVRPGLVVVPGRGIDSVRTIVRRDLDYSDRFELIAIADPGAGASAAGPINYGLYKALGAEFAVELLDQAGRVTARLHDVTGSMIRYEVAAALPPPADAGFRLAVHALSDELVRRATGEPGIAASRLLLVLGGRVYQMDSDGYGLRPLTPEGQTSLSPTWSPDGRRFAFTRLGAGRGGIYVQTIATGETSQVPGTESALNITPAWAPDGRTIAYAQSDERGTDIYTATAGERGSARRLTVGRFADNLSPTYSHDGRRIAFISTRAGPPQLYVMAADGTDPELLAPFDYGVTGSSNGPEWSPDGSAVVFHREVQGTAQIHVLTVSGRNLRVLTSAGRNEDPTWAPDGRHVAFVSDRSGQRQLWVIDSETGRVRQLPTPGRARLPSWSRRLAGAAPVPNP